MNPSAYEDQTNLKPGLHKNYDDEIRGEEAGRSMFNALQMHFNQTKDDPCPIKFLNEISNNFIIELLIITNSDI